MRKIGALFLFLILIQFVVAQTPIPQSREIPGPPVPSFGDGRGTLANSQENNPSAASIESSSNGLSVPSLHVNAENLISTPPLSNPVINVPAPIPQAPREEDLARIAALEEEVRTLREEINKLSAPSIVKKEKTVWPWVGLLILILAIGILLFMRKQKHKPDIYSYVVQARAAGMSDSEIIQRLKQGGWDDNSILSALGNSKR